MNMDMELILEMALDLIIQKDPAESQEQWMCRVIYSALGHTALASLWDQEEDLTPISVVHFKKRIERNYVAFKRLFPSIANVFLAEEKELTEEIYDIYESTGFFYHSPNRLSSSALVKTKLGGVNFYRGLDPGSTISMSGLGFYKKGKPNKKDSNYSLAEMFGLEQRSLKENFNILISSADWKEDNISLRKEYLRTDPPFTKGYWKDNPDLNEIISLFRTGMEGGYLYYLYQRQNGRILISQLPQWLTDGYSYRNVSNWILSSINKLPDIDYHLQDKLVEVNINYLLPPREMYFLKLYSWPKYFKRFPCDFNRVFSKSVFSIIKETLQQSGYTFKEV